MKRTRSITCPRLVTRRQLADELAVHVDTITAWHDQGLPIAVHGGRGRPAQYDADACRAWKVAREELAATDGPIDLMKERARKERAQALLAEQLYAVRSGKLLDAAEVLKRWSGEYGAIKTVLLASYTSTADRVLRAGTLEGLPGVERELKAIAHAALREISDPDRPAEAPNKKPRKKPAGRRETRR